MFYQKARPECWHRNYELFPTAGHSKLAILARYARATTDNGTRAGHRRAWWLQAGMPKHSRSLLHLCLRYEGKLKELFQNQKQCNVCHLNTSSFDAKCLARKTLSAICISLWMEEAVINQAGCSILVAVKSKERARKTIRSCYIYRATCTLISPWYHPSSDIAINANGWRGSSMYVVNIKRTKQFPVPLKGNICKTDVLTSFDDTTLQYTVEVL